ncbi:MAG TPA: hypothetical protein VGC15_18800 [Acetobacteraceae bacterium]
MCPCLFRGLSLGLPLAAAGLLSGCYPAQPVLYSPGSQYYQPQYGSPQYPPPPPGYSRPASPEPAPPPPETTYDTRPEEPFSPTIVEPSTPSPPASADDGAFLLPKADIGTGNTGDTPAVPAPPGPATRARVPRNSVPLMGFRPMRGQQGS